MPGPRTKPERQPTTDRDERLAVSVFDLDPIHAVVKAMLAGRVDFRREAVVKVGKDAAAPLICSLLDAAVVLDLLRSECRRVGDPAPRVYVRRDGRWSAVPPETVLTVLNGAGPELSQTVFPPPKTAPVWVPPPKTRVEF